MYVKANSIGYDREREWETRPNSRLTFSLSPSRCSGGSADALPMSLTAYCLSVIFPHWLLLLLGHWGESERSTFSDRARSGKDKQIQKGFQIYRWDGGSDICIDKQWILKSCEENKQVVLSVMQNKVPKSVGVVFKAWYTLVQDKTIYSCGLVRLRDKISCLTYLLC